MDREEYTSDEGNYSSISSASGFSAFDDEADTREGHVAAEITPSKKCLHVSVDQHLTPLNANIWDINHISLREFDKALLEKINEELGLQNTSCTKKNREFQQQYVALQKEVVQLNDDKVCRETCISHLKNKITEQQANIHSLIQKNSKLNIDLQTVQNDFITTKGTVDWYKKEWLKASNERNTLQKEVYLLKNNLRSKKLELTRLEALLYDLKLKSVHCKHSIDLFSDKFETTGNPEVNEENHNTSENKATKDLIQYYSNEIEELNKEISRMKKSFQQQTEIISQLVKDKSELVQKNIVLQKEVDDSHNTQVMHANLLENMRSTNVDYVKAIRIKDERILELTTCLKAVNIQLEASVKEKMLIQTGINAMRNGFHKLIALHDKLKDELKQKSKIVMTFEEKMQAAFMQENWSKCAIEKFTIKEANNMKKFATLEEEIAKLQSQTDVKSMDGNRIKLELDETKKYCKHVVADNHALAKKLEVLSLEKSKLTKNNSNILENFCLKFGIEPTTINIEEVMHYVTLKCQSVDAVGNSSNIAISAQPREHFDLSSINIVKDCLPVKNMITQLQHEVRELKDAVHLKTVELSEKQKRYERHYRALLKKVKQYKMEAGVTQQENKQLRNQQQQLIEELKSQKLDLFECSDDHLIIKKTGLICDLTFVKEQKHDMQEQCMVYTSLEGKHRQLSNCYDALQKKYDELVSIHSNCSSAIEAPKHLEQEQLDNDKIANCTILNTQHALIDKLEVDKSNALRLISTLQRLNGEYLAQIESLQMDKVFLQRLIIDMKADLDASASKQKFHLNKSPLVPLDLAQYSCPILQDEKEILSLCESETYNKNNKALGVLEESMVALKHEMNNMQLQLLSLHGF